MKKIHSILTTLSLTSLVTISTGCECPFDIFKKEDPCKDGCQYSANYICDMTCPYCNTTYRKLESDNLLTKKLESINYQDAVIEFYKTISIIYQCIEDYEGKDQALQEKIYAEVETLYSSLSDQFEAICTNSDYFYKANCEEFIYGNDKYWQDLMMMYDDITNAYYNVAADLYFSSLRPEVLEKCTENDEFLKEIKDSRYSEVSESDDDLNPQEPTLKETLYDSIMNYDVDTGNENDFYALAFEYFSLLQDDTPEGYNNYYEYALDFRNDGAISLSKAQEYFSFFKKEGSFYYRDLKKATENEKYSYLKELIDAYDTPGKNKKGINTLQSVVEYLQNLKNDKMNAFDIINDAYKDGNVFYGTDESRFGSAALSFDDCKVIVFGEKNNVDALTHAHEFGHYLDAHNESHVYNEFTAITSEILFYSYLYHHYNAKNQKEKDMFEKFLIFKNYQMASYYSMYEEMAYAFVSDKSLIDPIFEDGISMQEYKDFFNMMYTCYGFETPTLKEIVSTIQHIIDTCGYEMSYVVQHLYGVNTLLNAINDYDTVVKNYIDYLSCDGTDSILNDMLKCGFCSPLDSNVFTNVSEDLNNFLNKENK